ncbi:MAG: aminotransferase class I and II [Actinomycetota bacterium]|nr:aminotransferase class I and II [Actinomycetota bacterium]
MPNVAATRYVSPLREGGSLPGLLEADDDGIYVVKWTGAGQGPLALVAEIIGIELARALGLRVPELAIVEVDKRLAEAEPDPEIQDLLRASAGINLGIDFLPGAVPFELRVAPSPAADVVWLDGWLLNVDRTPRNPNLLSWHRDMWLIDFGAALYPQHGTDDLAAQALRPFPALREHVLAVTAEPLGAAHERLTAPARAAIEETVSMVPESWLVRHPREAYAEFLRARLEAAPWLGEAAR